MKSSDPFETDGRDEYICCYDEGVLDNDIWNIVSSAKGRVFLIFDCCHSQTMFRSPGIRLTGAAKSGLKARSSVGMLCWSGCQDNSYSYGSSSGGEFTIALRKYAADTLTYDEVWKKISSDERLSKH